MSNEHPCYKQPAYPTEFDAWAKQFPNSKKYLEKDKDGNYLESTALAGWVAFESARDIKAQGEK